jgi:hypothetical protein
MLFRSRGAEAGGRLSPAPASRSSRSQDILKFNFWNFFGKISAFRELRCGAFATGGAFSVARKRPNSAAACRGRLGTYPHWCRRGRASSAGAGSPLLYHCLFKKARRSGASLRKRVNARQRGARDGKLAP